MNCVEKIERMYIGRGEKILIPNHVYKACGSREQWNYLQDSTEDDNIRLKVTGSWDYDFNSIYLKFYIDEDPIYLQLITNF